MQTASEILKRSHRNRAHARGAIVRTNRRRLCAQITTNCRLNGHATDRSCTRLGTIGTDPAGHIDGPNLYTYAGNDPINFVDPSGLFSQTPIGKLFKGIGNALGNLASGNGSSIISSGAESLRGAARNAISSFNTFAADTFQREVNSLRSDLLLANEANDQLWFYERTARRNAQANIDQIQSRINALSQYTHETNGVANIIGGKGPSAWDNYWSAYSGSTSRVDAIDQTLYYAGKISRAIGAVAGGTAATIATGGTAPAIVAAGYGLYEADLAQADVRSTFTGERVEGFGTTSIRNWIDFVGGDGDGTAGNIASFDYENASLGSLVRRLPKLASSARNLLRAPNPTAKGLADLPYPTRHNQGFVRAGELLDEGNIQRLHPINPDQMLGSARAGHGGVRNLSNDDLIRFGSPQGTDPITVNRVHTLADDPLIPGSRLEIRAVHHRLEEIRRRVQNGTLSPDTVIEVVQPR